ncbi:MAG: ATPase, T2SS/T4P/T4SS family [bacterium]|mgnify:CR=1 FL=1|nr:ATPase, T2SS/T4P/T4SS family [bacterium]
MKRIDLKLLEEDTNLKSASLLTLNGGKSSSTSQRRYLSPVLIYILRESQREVGVALSDRREDLSNSELQVIVQNVALRLGFELSSIERDEVLSHLERGQKEFGILQELVDDPDTSDIIITNYSKIDVQQRRKNLSTDLSFSDQDSYESFVERLLQKAGSSYSTAKPIADGMIGSFARIHVVHKCICETGPYLTIRINRFPSVALEDLIRFNLAPEPVLAYLKALVRSGQTVLVVGEVGTGKTTLIRALASSISQNESILVIEDTPEIILEHPHVRYIYTREANTDGAGRVPPAECIRAGMRMAMNRIIFGEMRDAEAAEAFVDVCASGHPGLSTIHARNALEAVSRLELFLGRAQKGVSRNVIYDQISKSVQAIVFLDICKITGRRRIMEVKEIGPVADGIIRHRDIFQYKVVATRPTWKVPTKASAHREQLETFGFCMSELPEILEVKE